MRPPVRLAARTALAVVLAVSVASAASAQDAAPAPVAQTAPGSLPANDDVADGTDTTDVGLLQVEIGGLLTRADASTRTAGTPLMLRYGAFEWLEVSAGTDGYLLQRTADGGTLGGLGNTLLGARVRLFARRGGLPIVSLLPLVALPTASAAKGLGSGDTDTTFALLTGRDLPRASHVDVSYGIGAIGDGEGGHFAQHTAMATASLGVTPAWTPALTLTWVSRQDPATGAAAFAAAESVVTLSRRLAFDTSVTVGLNRNAPAVEIAAGLSIVVGELDLDDGVHARRHRLRLRAKKRPKVRRLPPDVPPPINAAGMSVASRDTMGRAVR